MSREKKLENLLSDVENIDLTLSYSRVSDFDRNGPKALLEKSRLDNQGVKMGSIIDDMLFSPDDFKTRYYISEFNEPTATLGTLAEIIIKNYEEIPDVPEILNIISRSGLWKSVKNQDLLIKNFNTPEFWGYLTDIFNSRNKILITNEEKSKAEEITTVLVNHPFSKHIFSADLEHIYQHKFETQIGQFKFRGIIDIVSIDHKKKKVYFIDLKTGAGSANEFTSSFVKFRYYLQEAVYQLAFEQVCKDLELTGYEQAPFEFLYIGLKERIPVRFVITQKWHDSALNGFKTTSGYEYKGLYQLVDEIYFHWRNKVYDLPKNIYDGNGIIEIEDNFIN